MDDQAFDIMIILADRSFIYLITPVKPPASTPVKPATNITNCEQDLFVYIIIKRYNSKQFYGVIIDIGVSKMSIIGYRQYLVYRNTIINDIEIDTL